MASSTPSAAAKETTQPAAPVADGTKHSDPWAFRFFAVGAFVVSVCVASFAFMVVHAPPDVSASASFSNTSCSWRRAFLDFNPIGCVHLSFSNPTIRRSQEPSRSSVEWDGGCDGPIVAQLHEDFSGSDGELDYKEALDFVRAVEVRLDAAPSCGTSAAAKAKPHTCFAHATPGDKIGAPKAGHFAACIVGHTSSACRATLCA